MNIITLPHRDPGIRRDKNKALALTQHRLMILFMLFVVAFASIALRLVEMSLFHTGASRRRSVIASTPLRADIVDRNGLLLATDVTTYDIGVHPNKLLTDPVWLAPQISAILPNNTTASIYSAFVGKGGFHFLQRHVSANDVLRLNALGEPALDYIPDPVRFYPNNELASAIVGFTDIDGNGKAGVEREFDSQLSGPEKGNMPLALSIDARVQEALESELGSAMAQQRAIGAAGVILDVHTGEVMAMASLPQYNPNVPKNATPDEQFNRTTLGVYELGSTFKAMTIAMALDTGVVKSMADRYDARAPLKIANFHIHDDHALNRWLSIPEIFAYSSNIGAARIARDIGAARQRDYLSKLGFLEPVQIELKERGRPLYPTEWSEIATMTVGFGHGIAVSPLHLATAYAALVNGGIMHPATLLKVRPGANIPGKRIFTEATSRTMRALMRLVVTRGTGKLADAHGYRIGGKTGTAEKPQGGTYNHHALISTFAGAFPLDDPHYVIIAILDEPKGTKETFGYETGGWVSAPVVKNVVKRIGPMLGITPDTSRDVDLSSVLPFMK